MYTFLTITIVTDISQKKLAFPGGGLFSPSPLSLSHDLHIIISLFSSQMAWSFHFHPSFPISYSNTIPVISLSFLSPSSHSLPFLQIKSINHSLFSTFALLGIEYIGPSKRNVIILSSISYALGYMLLTLPAYYIRSWRTLQPSHDCTSFHPLRLIHVRKS